MYCYYYFTQLFITTAFVLCLHSSLTPFTEAIYLRNFHSCLVSLLEVAFSRSVSFKVSCFLQFNFNSCVQNVKRSSFFYRNIASMIRRGVHSSYQHHRTNGKQTNTTSLCFVYDVPFALWRNYGRGTFAFTTTLA